MYGRPSFKRAVFFTPQQIVDRKVQLHSSITQSLHFLRQLRRVHTITQHMKIQACLASSLPTVLVHNTWNNMQKELQQENLDFFLPQALKHLVDCPLHYSPRLLVSLLSLQKHLQQHYTRFTDERRSDYGQKRKQHMLNSPHPKKAFQYIANSYSPPIHALRDAQGRFVITPDDIDELMLHSWSSIYRGNVAM